MQDLAPHFPTRTEFRAGLALFLVCLGFHLWAMTVGWESKNLPGVEFRQAQTALSAYFIKQEGNFSPAYPTPVLGKPWSIPMEFPLYQWTVARISDLTGLGIAKAGRLTSMAGFYLLVPAVYLLLDRWRVAPARRWLALALFVTCPLYIFYARAVLIETMALMFAVWFWVAFERAVAGRHCGWLVVAAVTGSGAGLVKVTTFLVFLVPAALWCARRLGSSRANSDRTRDLAWMSAAVVLPFAATLWWLHFSDATKALNPLADFLDSANLRTFNLGTTAMRLSPDLWARKWRIISEELTWLPAVGVCFVLWLAVSRRRWVEVALCTGVFLLPLAVFPLLYALHDYYFLANTVMLSLALALGVVAIVETLDRPGFGHALVLAIAVVQAGFYFAHYYPVQAGVSPGGDGLTDSLRVLTQPDEIVVVAGQDWNSMIPYYAQRRALMVRYDAEQDARRLDAAFRELAGEKFGALVVAGPLAEHQKLIDRLVSLGFAAEPLYSWGPGTSVFLPRAHEKQGSLQLQENLFQGVHFSPGKEPATERFAGQWREISGLTAAQRLAFQAIQPQPVRFYTQYGLRITNSPGKISFNAHPVTCLVFRLPAGHHSLRATVEFNPAAYVSAVAAERTDGVQVVLWGPGKVNGRRALRTELIDPVNNPADRGIRALKADFTLDQPGEVELQFRPAPNHRDTRDWISLDRLVIDETAFSEGNAVPKSPD
jgi:hypothetical protein